jgi:hypothetical protein
LWDTDGLKTINPQDKTPNRIGVGTTKVTIHLKSTKSSIEWAEDASELTTGFGAKMDYQQPLCWKQQWWSRIVKLLTGNLDTNRRELTAGQKKVIKNLSYTAGKAGGTMEYSSENRPA